LSNELRGRSMGRRTGLLILPYRPNYIMFYSKNFTGNLGGLETSQAPLQDVEAKFQFSLRMPIARGLFWGHGDFQIEGNHNLVLDDQRTRARPCFVHVPLPSR